MKHLLPFKKFYYIKISLKKNKKSRCKCKVAKQSIILYKENFIMESLKQDSTL